VEITDASALEREARDHPETFSPNVLLRLIVEDSLFPTVSGASGRTTGVSRQLREVYAQLANTC
jgi:uncharacterized protein YllA (UPF0747 family)